MALRGIYEFVTPDCSRSQQRMSLRVCVRAWVCMHSGEDTGTRFLNFQGLDPIYTPPPPPPTSLSVQPVSVCGDQVFVIIVSASFGGGAVLAVVRVLAVLGPTPSFFLWRVVQSQVHHGSASWPGTGAAGSCRRASRSRLPRLVCAAMCWRVAVRLGNTLDESLVPVRYLALLKNAPYAS